MKEGDSTSSINVGAVLGMYLGSLPPFQFRPCLIFSRGRRRYSGRVNEGNVGGNGGSIELQ